MKTRLWIFAALSLSLFVTSGSAKEATNIRPAILAEIKKYPALQMQDLYKLTYQAAMGNEHLMSDTAMVRKYLLEEFAAVDSSSTEPSIEYLTTDSSIARINLRPFKAKNRNPESLFQVMLKTASLVRPSLETLRRFWGDVESLAEEGKIPFKKKDLRSYFQTLEEQGFPAVSHSQTVENIYRPAYRIIAGKKVSLP
jgi:hypothetical protein